MKNILSIKNRYRASSIVVVSLSLMLVTGSGAYAALTFTNDDVTSDEDITITGVANAANSVYLRANGGTSETIKVHAVQGTGIDSINLQSDAGGITLQSAKADFGEDAILIATSNEEGGGTIHLDSSYDINIDAEWNISIATVAGTVRIDGDDGVSINSAGGDISIRNDEIPNRNITLYPGNSVEINGGLYMIGALVLGYTSEIGADGFSVSTTEDRGSVINLEATSADLATITNGQSGQMVTLIFNDAVTVTDDDTCAFHTINLVGSGNFTSAADDVLQLVKRGSCWLEISRSVNN